MQNEHDVIGQVGQFLGHDLDVQKISEISKLCSIESMRKSFSEKTQAMSTIMDETKTQFVRKGKIDQLNHWNDGQTREYHRNFSPVLIFVVTQGKLAIGGTT